MPYPPLKSECYENLLGINRKLSTYLTGPQEFLNLQNMDFRTTGSLSSFAGSTQIVSGGITGIVTGIADFTQGAATFGLGSYFKMATGSSGLYDITGATFRNVYPFIQDNTILSFSFVKSSVLYGTNRSDFFRYPGSTNSQAIQYSLPKPFLNSSVFATRGASGLISGTFIIYWAFQRYDGQISPILDVDYTSLLALVGHSVSAAIVRIPQLNTTNFGISNGSFGISSLIAWYSLNGSDPASKLGIPFTSSTFAIDDSFSGFSTRGDFDDYFGTFLYGFNAGNGATSVITIGAGFYNPTTIEQYASALFAGGFAEEPDTVWYSRPGEFEKHDLDGFFDFRANDGDIISCLKNYFTQLIIFKVNSIGQLSGTDANSFTLAEVTTQYGNLSNNSACIWNQRLWFLDKKGVCEYNGANTRIVSDRIEYIFLRMNTSVAQRTASMLHVKERNEVWCAIPIDGATTNNIIVVYDYLADAWTTRTINNLSYLTNFNQGTDKQLTVKGDLSGMVSQYGNSLTTDNGVAYTSVIQTRFCHDMGHSVEKMFRRLYVDVAVPAGSTFNITANFYTNQGSSPALTQTFAISEFQKRLDFGLSAKDMSVEFIYSEGKFLKLNGYTLEYRFQRNT